MSQRFNYSQTLASQLGIAAETNKTTTLSQKIDAARIITGISSAKPEKEELCSLSLEISEMMGDFNAGYYSPDDFYSCGIHIK